MTDRPSIEDLRVLRRNLPSKWWYGSEILGILLDDLIERRAADEADRYVCPSCLGGDHAGPATVGHGHNGRGCEYGCDAPLTATAGDLPSDPTGDET